MSVEKKIARRSGFGILIRSILGSMQPGHPRNTETLTHRPTSQWVPRLGRQRAPPQTAQGSLGKAAIRRRAEHEGEGHRRASGSRARRGRGVRGARAGARRGLSLRAAVARPGRRCPVGPAGNGETDGGDAPETKAILEGKTNNRGVPLGQRPTAKSKVRRSEVFGKKKTGHHLEFNFLHRQPTQKHQKKHVCVFLIPRFSLRLLFAGPRAV